MGKPWERQKGETSKAFAAFLAYRGLAGDRTLPATRERIGNPSPGYEQTLWQWSTKYDWPGRSHAYDVYLDSIRVAETAASVVVWERRRIAALDRKWEIGEKMLAKAAEMLDHPLTQEVVDGPNGERCVVPAKWSQATAVSMAKTGSDMALNASEEATIDQDTFDPLSATLEECQAYIASKKAKAEAIRKARAEQ